jgi:hypothetical protein
MAPDIHAINLPVFLLQDRVRERAADEAVCSEDENFEWHGLEKGGKAEGLKG